MNTYCDTCNVYIRPGEELSFEDSCFCSQSCLDQHKKQRAENPFRSGKSIADTMDELHRRFGTTNPFEVKPAEEWARE